MKPRALILHLLLGAQARADAALGVRELLGAGALFGHAPNTIRVALARAVAGGWLVAPRRGAYALGPMARPLADDVGRWRDPAAQTAAWNGEWIAVHAGAAGRGDRTALRARERAFALLGLAEFERGLYLRPDNLAGGVAALRARLQALLGSGSDAGTAFALSALAPDAAQRARTLWDGAQLDAGYRATTVRLSAWLDGAHALPLARAAREAFELGHQAIRQRVFDPWLPPPLVDAESRQRFLAAVTRHDAVGQTLWQQYLAALRAPGAAPGAPRLESELTQENPR